MKQDMEFEAEAHRQLETHLNAIGPRAWAAWEQRREPFATIARCIAIVAAERSLDRREGEQKDEGPA